MTTADLAVVIGIGGDSVDACSSALAWGAAEAQRRGRPVHLVHGLQPAPMLVEPEAAIEARQRAGTQALGAARRRSTRVRRPTEAASPVVVGIDVDGRAAQALLAAAEGAT